MEEKQEDETKSDNGLNPMFDLCECTHRHTHTVKKALMEHMYSAHSSVSSHSECFSSFAGF